MHFLYSNQTQVLHMIKLGIWNPFESYLHVFLEANAILIAILFLVRHLVIKSLKKPAFTLLGGIECHGKNGNKMKNNSFFSWWY